MLTVFNGFHTQSDIFRKIDHLLVIGCQTTSVLDFRREIYTLELDEPPFGVEIVLRVGDHRVKRFITDRDFFRHQRSGLANIVAMTIEELARSMSEYLLENGAVTQDENFVEPDEFSLRRYGLLAGYPFPVEWVECPESRIVDFTPQPGWYERPELAKTLPGPIPFHDTVAYNHYIKYSEAHRKKWSSSKAYRKAANRAHKLLMDSLSAKQRKCYEQHGHFYVKSQSGAEFIIVYGTTRNVVELNSDGMVENDWCLTLGNFSTVNITPIEDCLLVQKLLLETDEGLFRRKATRRLAKKY